MPSVAPDIWTLSMVTGVPAPMLGVTGFGSYGMGFDPPSIVPVTIGFAGSPASATVLKATVPLNAELRLTRNAPGFETLPLVGTLTVPGLVIEKSGICWVTPE